MLKRLRHLKQLLQGCLERSLGRLQGQSRQREGRRGRCARRCGKHIGAKITRRPAGVIGPGRASQRYQILSASVWVHSNTCDKARRLARVAAKSRDRVQGMMRDAKIAP